MLSCTLSSITRRVHIVVRIVLASLCLSACIVRTGAFTPEPVSLTFACPGSEVHFFQNAAEAFQQDNPLVQIHFLSVEDVVSFPLDEMDVLGPVRDLASHADVFLWTDDGAEGGPVGLVLDLTRYVEGDEEMVEGAFLPGLLARFQWQGSSWAVPSSVSASFIAYDPLAFDEAGLERPVPGWTWEEFAYAAQQLTRREGEQVIRHGADLGVDAVRSAVEARGGRLVDNSKGIAVPLLDDPRTVSAVQWYTDLALGQGVAKNPTDTRFRTPIDTLLRGEAAMSVVPSGMWPPGASAKDRELLLVPLPGKSRVNSRGYYVSAGTAHPEAAWRWIEYLSHEVVPPGGLPARQRSVHESPHVQAIGEEAATALLYAVEHTLSPTRPTIIERLLYDATERILSGQPVGDTLARAQQVALNPDTSLETEAIAVSTPTCFCQTKTGPFDHRKEGHFGHSVRTLTIENRST